jgi:hypothetical protein
MVKERFRLRLYWFLNVDAIGSICIVVLLWTRRFPRYFPLIIVGPFAFVCVLGAEAYRDRFYTRMGWDKERIPPKSVKTFWRYFTMILLFLYALMCHIMIKINYQA